MVVTISVICAQKYTERIGTAAWMAPEVQLEHESYDEAADVFSFGVVMWELLTLNKPYDGLIVS